MYCEKISNDLREKFRTFSGKAHMAIEVRVSQDRIEGLENLLQSHVDAVTRILDQNRGDWGNGMFYTGGYEAVFGEMAHGGRNFIQTGKITFRSGSEYRLTTAIRGAQSMSCYISSNANRLVHGGESPPTDRFRRSRRRIASRR